MLIDTHAHLTDAVYAPQSGEFGGVSVAEIIGAMPCDGIEKIISIGYDEATSEGAAKIAQEYSQVYFAAGIHPSEANRVLDGDLEVAVKKIEQISRLKKCVAIGEIGLDYHYENSDADKQKALMLSQMELAKMRNLPVIFHVRDAFGDSMQIIKGNLDLLPKRGVMHCYSGSAESAREFIKMGFYISFSGSLTFKNAENLRYVARGLPRDMVLTETDCPYLSPTPFRGKTNYPKYVNITAQTLAAVWETSESEVGIITRKNAKRLFELE